MVDDLIDSGAVLLRAISKKYELSELPAVVARNASTGDWNLVLGLPRELSRLDVYELVQRKLVALGQASSLENVLVVRDNEPGLQEMVFAATRRPLWSQVRSRSDEESIFELMGKEFASPLVVRLTPRSYERSVWRMLRGFSTEIAQGGVAFEGDADAIQALDERESSFRPDFASWTNEVLLLIEVKLVGGLLQNVRSRVLEALGILAYWERRSQKRVALLLIVDEVLPPRLSAAFEGLDGVEIVSWTPGDSTARVSRAVERLLAGPRGSGEDAI